MNSFYQPARQNFSFSQNMQQPQGGFGGFGGNYQMPQQSFGGGFGGGYGSGFSGGFQPQQQFNPFQGGSGGGMQQGYNPMFGGIGGLGFNPMMGQGFGMPMQGMGGYGGFNPYQQQQQQFNPYQQQQFNPYQQQFQPQQQQFNPTMDMRYRGESEMPSQANLQSTLDMRQRESMAGQGGVQQPAANPFAKTMQQMQSADQTLEPLQQSYLQAKQQNPAYAQLQTLENQFKGGQQPTPEQIQQFQALSRQVDTDPNVLSAQENFESTRLQMLMQQRQQQQRQQQRQQRQQPMYGGIGGLGFNPMMGAQFGMPMGNFGYYR